MPLFISNSIFGDFSLRWIKQLPFTILIHSWLIKNVNSEVKSLSNSFL